jgi:hypothetical protein
MIIVHNLHNPRHFGSISILSSLFPLRHFQPTFYKYFSTIPRVLHVLPKPSSLMFSPLITSGKKLNEQSSRTWDWMILPSERKPWRHLRICAKHASLQPATVPCAVTVLSMYSVNSSSGMSSPLNHIWSARRNLPHIRFTALAVAQPDS